jgi:hypothetical protein
VNAQTYSWYGDEELHALLEQYISRATDAAAAGRKLKLWLGSGGGSAPQAGAPGPRRPRSPTPQTNNDPIVFTPAADGHVWLTRKEAAQHLGLSVKTLGNWAKDPAGPPFRRKGGVRYRLVADEALPLIRGSGG